MKPRLRTTICTRLSFTVLAWSVALSSVLSSLLSSGCASVQRVRGEELSHRRPARSVDASRLDVPVPRFSDDDAWAFFDGNTGAALSLDDLLQRARAADVVVVGEQHDQAVHHELQRRVVSVLASESPGLVVGVEMLTWSLQDALDRFNAGQLDAEGLAVAVDWPKAWGFPFALYADIFTSGRTAGARFVALNAPRDLVKAVRRKGIDGLSRAELALLPDLDLGDAVHRQWFRDIFAQGGHPMSAADVDSFYVSQVVWDEGMAERASEVLAAGASKVVILAGVGHVAQGRGIPQRVERRRPGARVLSIVPLADVDADNVVARVRAAVASGEGDVLVVPKFDEVLAL